LFLRWPCGASDLVRFCRPSESVSFDPEISQHHYIHLCPQKAIESLLRTTHHWFVFVEGSIQNDRNGSQPAEFRDHLIVKRIRVGMDGLQTAKSVHLTNSRRNRALFQG